MQNASQMLKAVYRRLVPLEKRHHFKVFWQQLLKQLSAQSTEIPAPQSMGEIDRIKEKWSKDLTETDVFSAAVYWLAVPEVIQRHQFKAMKGASYQDWIEYFVQTHLKKRMPVNRMASVGCGDGSLERRLYRLNAFKHCDAFDIAPGAIQSAQQKAKEEGIDTINYEVQDMNHFQWKRRYYDAVWFNGSLHHIEKLEYICEQVAASLRPGGFLFFNEYIGPSYFDFTARQKEVMQAAFTLIPQRFRKAFTPNYPHEYQQVVSMPDPEEVKAVDPSESVRSSEIMDVVKSYFDIVEFNPMGGTILHYLLSGIAGNFRKEDPESIEVLNMLFNIEDVLLKVGDIQSDFACIVAVPK